MNRVTLADIVLLCLILSLGISLLASGGGKLQSGKSVMVKSVKGETLTLDLSQQQTADVEGLLGTTSIAIEDGGVRFLASPCPHSLCVKKGTISKAGEWIACLPNGVIAQILGDTTYDGITP